MALAFVFDRAYYQGRRDEVSYKFELALLEALKEMVGSLESPQFERLIEYRKRGLFDHEFRGRGSEGWKSYKRKFSGIGNPLIDILEKKYEIKWEENGKESRHKTRVGKPRDLEMVVSILNFVEKNTRGSEYNFLKYAIKRIKQKELINLHTELCTIRQVNDKIASLILRDIVLVYLPKYDEGKKLSKEEYECIQPIDTWVRQLSGKYLGLKGSDEEICKGLVRSCNEAGVSPILFNSGLWYIGKHSLDIAIQNLTEYQRRP